MAKEFSEIFWNEYFGSFKAPFWDILEMMENSLGDTLVRGITFRIPFGKIKEIFESNGVPLKSRQDYMAFSKFTNELHLHTPSRLYITKEKSSSLERYVYDSPFTFTFEGDFSELVDIMSELSPENCWLH